jgi:copper resistance protein D
MLVFGAHNAWVSRRNLRIASDDDQNKDAALRAVRRSLATELTLGIVVIGLVALLGMLSPMLME